MASQIGKDGGFGSTQRHNQKTIQEVQPLDMSTIKAPSSSIGANNKLTQEVNRDEARATAAGTDPDALYRSLHRVKTRGGQEVATLSKGRKARFDKAVADFEARGGGNATAEATSRGVSGGSFQTQGDFSGGGATIGGVKPLGG